MEDFNVKYYAHHVKFMICLLNHKIQSSNIGICQKEFSYVTKEALFRDIASRAYYTAYLTSRDKLVAANMLEDIASTNHTLVRNKLSHQFKTLLLELKSLREGADYNTKVNFSFPQQVNNIAQYHLLRLETVMNKFLAADHNQLTP